VLLVITQNSFSGSTIKARSSHKRAGPTDPDHQHHHYRYPPVVSASFRFRLLSGRSRQLDAHALSHSVTRARRLGRFISTPRPAAPSPAAHTGTRAHVLARSEPRGVPFRFLVQRKPSRRTARASELLASVSPRHTPRHTLTLASLSRSRSLLLAWRVAIARRSRAQPRITRARLSRRQRAGNRDVSIRPARPLSSACLYRDTSPARARVRPYSCTYVADRYEG